MSYWEQKAKEAIDKLKRQEKSGLRKCPGHWINKRMKLKNNDCYNDKGQCFKCGGWRKNGN